MPMKSKSSSSESENDEFRISTACAALLDELRNRGVRITVEGENLRCRVPGSELTPELREKLQRHKADLLQIAREDPWGVSRLLGVRIISRQELPLCQYHKHHRSFWRRRQDDSRLWCCQTCHPSPFRSEKIETFEWNFPPVL
jgi:hypothetical protein